MAKTKGAMLFPFLGKIRKLRLSVFRSVARSRRGLCLYFTHAVFCFLVYSLFVFNEFLVIYKVGFHINMGLMFADMRLCIRG